MALYIGSFAIAVTVAVWLLVTGQYGRLHAAILSGLAGLAGGFLAVQGLNYSLSGAAASACFLAAMLGAAAYRKGGVIGALQAALAGFALGEAGAWIGFRFYLSSRIVLVAMLLFVLLLFGMQKWIETRGGGAKKPEPAKRGGISPKKAAGRAERRPGGAGAIVLLGLAAAIGGALLANTDPAAAGRIGKADTMAAVYEEDNGLQTARIEVNGAGFNPRNIDFRPNVMIKLVFEVNEVAGKNIRFVSEDLNLDMELRKGDNAILIKDPKPGEYSFYIGDRGQSGKFTVLEGDS